MSRVGAHRVAAPPHEGANTSIAVEGWHDLRITVLV
jgi:hypothetical protein